MEYLSARVERIFGGVTLAYILSITAAVILRDWLRERKRIEGVVAETNIELHARADTIYSKVAQMQRSEIEARYDHEAWGETATAVEG